MKNRIAVSILLVSILCTAWAGGESETEQRTDVPFAGRDVTLRVGFQAGHVDPTEHMRVFREQHPNIDVEIVPIAADDWPDYITTLQTMVVSGTVPDVYHIAIEGIQRLVTAELAMPLDAFIEQRPDLVRNYEDLHPRMQEVFEIGDRTYAFAADWNNVVLHMNMDMLAERGLALPDEDWGTAEFISYMQMLTHTRNGRTVFGTMLPSFYFNLSAWLYAFGASVLNEEMTESVLTAPEAVAAFEFMHDLIYEYEVAPIPTVGDNPINEMIAGNVASVSLGRWPVGRFVEGGVNFDIVYLPMFEEREVIFGVGGWVVADATDYPEEAYALAAWMAGPYAQENMMGAHSIPSRISVMERVLAASPPQNARLFRESADVAIPVEAPPEYPDIALITMRYYTQIMSDEIGIEEGLRRAKEEIDALLA
ncbi:MAG: extracellular solute-binding protein, partial [Spirochaetales bacterium]|nr:extracellular solute-binding protein [Spirochaetales bacterium]